MDVHANAPLGLLIRLFDIRLARLTSEMLEPIGVSLAEISMLRIVEENPGIQASALAEALFIKPPNLSKLINRLESIGYLRRDASRKDIRAIALSLTVEGRKAVAFGQKVSSQVEAFALRDLSANERRDLLILLRTALVSVQPQAFPLASLGTAGGDEDADKSSQPANNEAGGKHAVGSR